MAFGEFTDQVVMLSAANHPRAGPFFASAGPLAPTYPQST